MTEDKTRLTTCCLRGLALALCVLGVLALPRTGQAQTTPGAQMDVVFVMDTSGSMGDEFAALCGQIDTLVTDLRADGIMVNYAILGIAATQDCAQRMVMNNVLQTTVQRLEDWGPAVADVSAFYPWRAGHVRLIIPMSDEGPYDGNPCESPGPDRDAILTAINAAKSNGVRVAPVFASQPDPAHATCNKEMAQMLADGTGGQVFTSQTPRDDLAAGIKKLLGAVAHDADGDGILDDQDSAPNDPCQPDPQRVCLPRQVCGLTSTPHWDDDHDGRTDEELPNDNDDDGDGLTDEDVGGPNCPFPPQRCNINDHRGFDDDRDGQVDEESPNGANDDGDGYVDEDIECPCPTPQQRGLETPGIDDDHDFRLDEETLNGADDDGDGCIDEDITGAVRIQITFPITGTVTSSVIPPLAVNGTADPGAQITVYKRWRGQDTPLGTAVVDQAGNWRLAPPQLYCGINIWWASAELGGQKSSSAQNLVISRPDPPGPYIGVGERSGGIDSSFSESDPLLATYYFYWFDAADPNNWHTKELAARSAHAETADTPLNPNPWRFDSVDYHHYELHHMLDAHIDVVLPVYWGTPCEENPQAESRWSNAGLTSIVQAASQIRQEGLFEPPKIGMFYDVSSLNINGGFKLDQPGADLAALWGKERFYLAIRDFYSLVPPSLRAEIDGRPIVWLYEGSLARGANQAAFDYVREQFAQDFNGKIPYIVAEDSWPKGLGDARYQWGAALGGMTMPGGIASVGPGFDERHLNRPDNNRVQAREDGAFYMRSWEAALAKRADLQAVVVETWNEWEEGTAIAASQRNKGSYIDTTADYALQLKAARVPYLGLSGLSPSPNFWRLADIEDRLLKTINERRARDGLDPLSRTPGAETAALGAIQFTLEHDVAGKSSSDGYRMPGGNYWLYRRQALRSTWGGFPTAAEADHLAASLAADIRGTRSGTQILRRNLQGATVSCLATDTGAYGCVVVLDLRPRTQVSHRRSPSNDADFGLLQPGDILVNANDVQSVADFVDWTQLLGYGALWHHAGIYVGDNQVVEAGTAGVELLTLEESSFWSSQHTAIYRVRSSGDVRRLAADYSRAQVGKPYNYNFFNKGNTSGFYCSQVPWAAYRSASSRSIDLDQDGGTPWWLDLPGLVTPDDLVMNSQVEHVSGGGTFLVGDWHAHSPVDFYVTDPQGRRVGMDPLLKRPVVEIPGATYDFEREPKHISISNLRDGEYIVTVVGTGEGIYGLENTIASTSGRSSDAITRTITTGRIEAFGVNISTANPQPPQASLRSAAIPPLVRPGVVGAVLGGLALVVLLAGIIYLVYRRGRQALQAGLRSPEGRWIPITADPWRIGRGPGNHLVLPGDLVSRQHAVIRRAAQTYAIEDLASTTGTFVNHQRVARAVLRDGDEIGIGETLMVFRDPPKRSSPHG